MSTTAHPTKTIWMNPRGTILRVVNNDPEYGVLSLACLTGIALASLELVPRSEPGGEALPVGPFIGALLVAGPIRGFVALYLGGWLLSLFGNWLGGGASCAEVRAAVAWSNVPVLLGVSGAWMVLAMPGAAPELAGVFAAVVLLLFLGWGYSMLALSLAAIQGFSLWKSVLSLLGFGIIAGLWPYLGSVGIGWILLDGLLSTGTA